MTRIQVPAPTKNPTLEGHKVAFLTAADVPQSFLDRLHERFPGLKTSVVHKYEPGTKDAPKLLSSEEWADVTILNVMGGNLPEKEEAPNMQYVQLTSAGANHIMEKSLFKDTEVVFCTANGVHGAPISEWVMAMFLSFNHHLPFYIKQQELGKWNRKTIDVEDAVQQRVGILGYGSIGRQCARLAVAMGMSVHAYNLHPRDTPESRRDDAWSPPGIGDPDGVLPSKWFSGGSKADLHEFLGSGIDLLVVAVPLTKATTGLLGKEEFAVLGKKKAFVANIARGPVLKQNDLIDALEGDVIRGAALDVTDPEPLPDGHRLWSTKNVLITPHVSGMSTVYHDRVREILMMNLERLSEGEKLGNMISRKEGY